MTIWPKEWQEYKVIDLVDKSDKYSFTGGPFGSSLKVDSYTAKGVRIIQLQNIGDGIFHDEYKIFTSEEKANELKSCNIYPNEIIMSKMGNPVARACFIPNSADRFVMASDGIRLKVDKKRFSSGYILEYINASIFREQAIKKSTGTTRQRISLTDLKNLKLVLPSIKEQSKISEVFDTWNEAILNTEEAIKTERIYKKALTKELFSGHIRFKKYILTQDRKSHYFIGDYPKDWQVVRIQECLENFTNGYAFNSAAYKKQGIPIISMSHIDLQGSFAQTNKNFNYWVEDDKLDRFMLTEGDLIIAMTDVTPQKNLIGRIVKIVNGGHKYFYLNQRVGKLIVNKNILDADYLRHYSHNYLWRKYCISRATLGVQANLSTEDIKKAFILIPSVEEQKDIAQTLNLIEDTIESLNKKLTLLKEQKRTLTHLLITGKVRVKV